MVEQEIQVAQITEIDVIGVLGWKKEVERGNGTSLTLH